MLYSEGEFTSAIPYSCQNLSVQYLFIATFIGGVLLGVRLMFYGAERRRRPSPESLPLRRWEPATISFLIVFGVTGYVLFHISQMSTIMEVVMGIVIGAICAVIITRLAIAAARFQPEHDPDDARFLLQGRVGVVTSPIPAGGEGMISYQDVNGAPSMRAREIGGEPLAAGVEICIDHLDDGVAYVEPWTRVEERL